MPIRALIKAPSSQTAALFRESKFPHLPHRHQALRPFVEAASEQTPAYGAASLWLQASPELPRSLPTPTRLAQHHHAHFTVLPPRWVHCRGKNTSAIPYHRPRTTRCPHTQSTRHSPPVYADRPVTHTNDHREMLTQRQGHTMHITRYTKSHNDTSAVKQEHRAESQRQEGYLDL